MASPNGSMLLRIDDTSPRLQYSGYWAQNGTEQDYLKTNHFSNATGSFVKFTFNGTYITVYGNVDARGCSSSYKLDDAPPVVTNISPGPSPQNNYPYFFPSAPLQPGLHELIITVVGGAFDLDYIEYTSLADEENVGDASLVPTGPTSPSSSAPLPPVSSSGSTASPDEGASTTPAKGLSAGAIAGIAIATVVVVLAVALALVYVRRRSARRVRHQRHMPEKGIDVLFDAPPKEPAAESRSPFRRLSRIYRPTPARSAQSSKTATSSAPTSITQSSAMFTSVIMLSPALSVVSEESGQHDTSRRVSGA